MKGSRSIILVVIVAVAGVVIAKQKMKAPPAVTEQAAETPQSAPKNGADDSKPDGPLPGSRLAECLISGRPTMADFGRTWCKPCKAMVPILKQAAKDYQGKANILFVDLGKYAKLGRNYRIRAMPTQIFFDAQGNEVGRHMGYMGSKDIERRLAELGVEK